MDGDAVKRWHEEERRLHEDRLDGLPDGVFVLHRGSAHLVLGERLRRIQAVGVVLTVLGALAVAS